MQSLTEALLTAAGFPDDLIPYVDRDVLIFSHARADGTLEFMIPNEAEPKSAFTLVWHPEDKATWDWDDERFHVKEEKFRDVDHYDPLGGDDKVDISQYGDEVAVEDLIDWLDNLPGSAGVPPAVGEIPVGDEQLPPPTPTAEPDRQAAGYLPACPHCRQRSHVRELEFWSAVSQTDPSNTVTLTEYQCHAPGCDGEAFWL